ncbi:MAG: response regulator [Spirochaetaceae bacterium]|jgi:CheY-like chemotaxis protein|nr:response regulator [Spirochaetaceae bacterium]
MSETERKKIIMAVDDMPEVLRSINAILKDKYDVRLSTDAASAQAALKNIKVDLILLDFEMPGISGMTFLENLQKNPDCKDIPVVFITANHDTELVKKAIKKGAKGYIAKPFPPESLLESVDFFCSQ